ncbi:hypothetical protein NE686_08165 [Tissierella carlieri]|uniref:YkoP-like domain-containing protein n=1 Tax=Tissierella carlieri TaxID=689904 RepID=A0ABT1S996_9FIRM|nr:hypothetical protein [Tissierella carlieri]MCQ4923053.1 hypothetical protein [Tissierella carlieri]
MRKLFLKIVELIDKKIVRHSNWLYIPHAKEQVLYVAPHIYRGKEKGLPDGTIIKRGDFLAEIHIDNQKIRNMDLSFKDIVTIFKDELDSLAYAVGKDSKFIDIKAFHGKTLLYPLLKREGFMIIDINSILNSFFVELWERILETVYSRKYSSKRRKKRKMKEFWITNDQLVDRMRSRTNL